MSNLSTEQLAELTERINGRIAEFDNPLLAALSPGVVRLAFGEIEDWMAEQESSLELGASAWLSPAPSTIIPDDAICAEIRRETEELAREREEVDEVKAPSPPTPEPVLTAQAVASLGPEHTVVTPLKSNGNGKHGTVKPRTHLPSLEEMVKELRRQAMGGVMPTMAAFDAARPANWSTAQAHLLRLATTWGDLAEAAGLHPRGKAA
jgi:hypothetical protein